METVLGALGLQGVQSLWTPLLQLEASNARQLQWLAVLACWSVPSNLSANCDMVLTQTVSASQKCIAAHTLLNSSLADRVSPSLL